jgi:hypothetical protein
MVCKKTYHFLKVLFRLAKIGPHSSLFHYFIGSVCYNAYFCAHKLNIDGNTYLGTIEMALCHQKIR